VHGGGGLRDESLGLEISVTRNEVVAAEKENRLDKRTSFRPSLLAERHQSVKSGLLEDSTALEKGGVCKEAELSQDGQVKDECTNSNTDVSSGELGSSEDTVGEVLDGEVCIGGIFNPGLERSESLKISHLDDEEKEEEWIFRSR